MRRGDAAQMVPAGMAGQDEGEVGGRVPAAVVMGVASAAERLQTVARGESEANTPRKETRSLSSCRVSAPGKCDIHLVPLTRHNSSQFPAIEGCSLRWNPS